MANGTNETSVSIPGRIPRGELALSLSLLGLLLVFLVPLPPVLLDVLLAFNLSATILLLLITLGVKQALDFSVFPSLLLLLTLFRLALNVATTRLILLNGNAGSIVTAFGNYVVGGNLIVGLVIFLILIIIQFVVITRGAGRVSEVSARFTLDAMPGKQMAIDAEMNAGLIDEKEAKRRREALMRESEFYGTMDGASKFVRGDAIAAVIITAVNLIGGIIIGVMKGQSIGAAVRTYSILTIGDGLITQIPALIIATASGMLVTKATSQASLGQEIGTQFSNSAGPMKLSALILVGLAFMPGMPTAPFLVLGGLLYYAARRITSAATAILAKPPVEKVIPDVVPKTPTEMYLDDFLQNDRISIDLGVRLITLVDSRRGPGLVDKITAMRRDIAKQSGLWVPLVRVRDNITLDGESYRVLIGGREVARGVVRPDMLMAVNPGSANDSLRGEEAVEPAFGLPAKWINESDRDAAELMGFTVVDATTVLITHLGEVVRRHASELLSREDLKTLLDKVKETSPAVVEELIPSQISMGTLHRVLTTLLDERVPITNMARILESLANHAPTIKDIGDLTERVRTDIGRSVCDRYRDEKGFVHMITMDPQLEMELKAGLRDRTASMDTFRYERWITRLGTEKAKANAKGVEVALLCDSNLRRTLRQALVRIFPDLGIIAYSEIPSDVLMTAEAIIRASDLVGGATPVSSSLNR